MASAAELLEQIESDFPNTVQQRVRTYNLKDSYKTVAWVYACCNLIADSISGVEFYFSREDSAGTKVPLDKLKEPVVYCFYPPRPGEIPTIAEMIKMQYLHLGLFGETFMLLEMKGKYPVQIDIINPLNITPVISKDGTSIEKWKVRQAQPGGNTVEKLVPVSQIVQWKYPNPYNKFRGMAPLTAARLAIEQDLNMATWNAGFFQNGLRNPIALMLKQTFNEPQRKEYMNRMKQNFMGFVKGQLPLLVEGGVDVRVLSNTMKDLDFVEGKELTREELCAVYNVPPAMAGIFRYANYSNTKEQRTMLYQNTLRPKMVYYRDVFQQSILDVYFPGVVCDWEWASIDAFKEDPQVEANVTQTLVNTAQTLWNMGYDQTQIAYILKRPELDPATHVAAQPPDIEIPEPEVPKTVHAPTISHSKDHMVFYTEKAYLRHIAIAQAAEVIMPTAQRLTGFVKAYFDQAQKGLTRATTAKVNVKFWTEQWNAGVEPLITFAFREGAKSAYRDLKAPEPEFILTEPLTSVLNEKLKQAQDIGHAFATSIDTALDGKKTKKEIEKALADLLPGMMDTIQVQRIVHRVFNLGRYEAMKLMGVEETLWCSGGNCDDGTHRTLNGVSVAVGRTFPTTTLTFPGEGKEKCSCTLFPLTVRKPEKKVKITRGA